MKMSWLKNPIRGILLDITGVLYESGTTEAIAGSVSAVNRLRSAGIPFRFVTNETQNTVSALVTKLSGFGYKVTDNELFAPAPAVRKILQSSNLRPYLLVHPNVLPEFQGFDTSFPNCVVIGDAAEHFTYERLNEAFRILITLEKPILVSMGKGKYYKEKEELVIDLGAYTTALEYACDVKAKVLGKPASEFFCSALNDIGISSEEAVMIGDDINSDVGAAQACGMRGVLVRTGKYRTSDENHPRVKPDAIVNNLAEAVDAIVQNMAPSL